MDLSPSFTESLGARINAAIDAALEAENAAQARRTYLGASRIGEECQRRLAYEFHGAEGEPFAGKTIRRFRLGHIHEDETARWLRLAGFVLHTQGADGEQYGFGIAPHPETGAPRFAGHCDGVITTGPVDLPYPCVFEHKIMKSDIWRDCQKNGVEKVHPIYHAQCIIYTAAFGLSGALFTALNSDTSEIYAEWVPANPTLDAQLRDKAARVIESRVPEDLPRVAGVATDYRCKWCPFRLKCWSEPTQSRHTVARPTWMRA